MKTVLLALLLAGPAPQVTTLSTMKELRAMPARNAPGTHVVHFWATWCGPCVDELPQLVQRARALAAEGVDFSFVSLDPEEALSTSVVPTLERTGAFFEGARHYLVADALDPDAITRAFSPRWQRTLPATFVYRDGKQVGFFHGASEEHALDRLGSGKSSR